MPAESMPGADADLVVALEDLGRNLDYPTSGDLAGPVVARLWDTPGRRPWAVPTVAAIAVVAAVVVLVVALPGPRRAIARWFGIGSVQIESVDELPADLGSELSLGEAVAVDEVSDRVAFDVVVPESLPGPSAAFAGRPPGGVSLVWAVSEQLPEVGDSGVGLLFSQFPGTTTQPLVEKELGPDTRIEVVEVGGRDAFWITGAPHAVTYLDSAGRPETDQTRLAGNTLVWEDGGVTYRLESALDRPRMIALAESVS
jgi:hypothetical protein